ncbi:MAG: argininosuccinate synthase [Bacillota bacterium]
MKVVLAYSGGLDTSIIIPWLKEHYNNCEVIAMAADVGQGEELAPLNEKAIKTGASKIYIEDLKEEFVKEAVFPLIKAGALYEGKYLLGTSIARPIIAKRLVEIAEKENADAICHGCTGKGNDQVRFELTIMALNPKIKIIAPWREWNIKSREEAIDYANTKGIPIPVTKQRSYSMDRNILHLSHEGQDLEDPWNEKKDNLVMICKTPEQAPDKAEYVTIDFEKGIPTAINGKDLDAVELLCELNKIGARNAVGIDDMVENRLVGMKSRGVYETPGGTILMKAHKELEEICLDRNTSHFKEVVANKFAELAYDGNWYTPLMDSIMAFVDETQRTVTGTVVMKLYKGNCVIAKKKSPYSLHDIDIATFDEDEVYDQKDSQGFIKLFGLPLKVRAMKINDYKNKLIKK